MGYVAVGDTVRRIIAVQSTAGLVNADSTPVVTVRQQGVAMGYAPTVTNITTGIYEVAIVCSSGNGFSTGLEYDAYVTAAISGANVGAEVGAWFTQTRHTDDLAWPAVAGRSIAVDTSGGMLVGGFEVSSLMPGGQLKPNSMIDNYVYDSSNNPTSWRVRVFANKAAAQAAVAGHLDNADSEVERYKFTAVYSGSPETLASYLIYRDL